MVGTWSLLPSWTINGQALRRYFCPRRCGARPGDKKDFQRLTLAYVVSRNLAYIVQYHPVEGEHGSNEFQIAHLLIDFK